jgi:hypothetical protein
VVQHPRGDEDCIKQLVDLQVSGLGLMKDLADVVHQSLDDSDPPGERGSSASISIGAGSMSSRSSGFEGTSEV